MSRWTKRIIGLVVVLGAIGDAGYSYLGGKDAPTTFRTEAVTRGDLVESISATGTVEPEEVIDVGAQVAGRIMAFGKDADGNTVDYNSPVKAGEVLAKIDDSLWKIDAANAAAQVKAAHANLQRAVADLGQYKAKLTQADRDWQRAKKLGPSDALAQSSYDAYQSAYETAKANLAVGEAAIAQAQAGLEEAKTVAERAQRNLSYCTITSPVDGVIIDRRVNMGQTVVASLNAPSLFLIAKDLRKMQVWVSVNEADIGKIKPGMNVSFTVDTMPDVIRKGTVRKIRLNANFTQNVLTYTVEVRTDNSDRKLLPYQTANVKFELHRRDNVLMVPAQALQWKPTSPDQIAPAVRTAYAAKRTGRQAASQAAGPETRPSANQGTSRMHHWAGSEPEASRGVVWVQDGQFVKPVKVHVGLSNGATTEVSGKGIREGMKVVTGILSKASSEALSPFAFRRSRGKQSGSNGASGGGNGQQRGRN